MNHYCTHGKTIHLYSLLSDLENVVIDVVCICLVKENPRTAPFLQGAKENPKSSFYESNSSIFSTSIIYIDEHAITNFCSQIHLLSSMFQQLYNDNSNMFSKTLYFQKTFLKFVLCQQKKLSNTFLSLENSFLFLKNEKLFFKTIVWTFFWSTDWEKSNFKDWIHMDGVERSGIKLPFKGG